VPRDFAAALISSADRPARSDRHAVVAIAAISAVLRPAATSGTFWRTTRTNAAVPPDPVAGADAEPGVAEADVGTDAGGDTAGGVDEAGVSPDVNEEGPGEAAVGADEASPVAAALGAEEPEQAETAAPITAAASTQTVALRERPRLMPRTAGARRPDPRRR
jgi:hypothetical protein